jgi:hypothetical protein
MHHVTAFIRSKELQLQLRRSPAPPIAPVASGSLFGNSCVWNGVHITACSWGTSATLLSKLATSERQLRQ